MGGGGQGDSGSAKMECELEDVDSVVSSSSSGIMLGRSKSWKWSSSSSASSAGELARRWCLEANSHFSARARVLGSFQHVFMCSIVSSVCLPSSQEKHIPHLICPAWMTSATLRGGRAGVSSGKWVDGGPEVVEERSKDAEEGAGEGMTVRASGSAMVPLVSRLVSL